MTVQPVTRTSRSARSAPRQGPRGVPPGPASTRPGHGAARAEVSAAPAATVLAEVAVAGAEALVTATRLASEIRDLIDSAGAEAAGVEVCAAVGVRLGGGGTEPAATEPAATEPAQPRLVRVPGPITPAAALALAAPPAPVVGAVDSATLRIYPARRVALLDGEHLSLTRREFDLLLFLSEHAGRVFDRPQLLRLVWGHQVICGERTVDVHIRRLRAKVEATGPTISTVRGIGYRLDCPERVAVVHEGPANQ